MTERPWLAGVPRSEWIAAAASERQPEVAGQRVRALAYRACADRPSQRRSGEEGSGPARVAARMLRQEVRESSDGQHLVYEGWASVTDTPYEMWDWAGPYTEQVTSGAFAKTLGQVDPPLDVPFVLQHDSLRRMARTLNGSLQLDEDATGLHVLAPQLDPADGDVAYIAPKLRSGLIDEMSFKFMITKGSWSPDWMEYHINEVDLHRGDVAIVAYGANPTTTGGLRSKPASFELPRDLSPEDAREYMAAFRQQYPHLAERTARRGAELISERETMPRVL
jgi:HK97 family phage prohead protease